MRKIFPALILIMLLSLACKKKEIQGPPGNPGTPGAGGNANISTSNTFVVTGAQWLVDSATQSLKATVPFSTLTKDIVDKGTVKVFRQTGSSWIELPYDSGDLFMQFGFQEGILSLYYINIEGGIPSSPGTFTYRMSIISPGSKQANDPGRENTKGTPDRSANH